jgi:ribonuclease P protein component
MMTFPRSQRLRLKREIDSLFANGEAFIAYPLRIIYLSVPEGTLIKMLANVPKRRFKHAVRRNLLRRRIRESYRLRKDELFTHMSNRGEGLLLAYLYIGKEIEPYATIDRAVERSIRQLKQRLP